MNHSLLFEREKKKNKKKNNTIQKKYFFACKRGQNLTSFLQARILKRDFTRFLMSKELKLLPSRKTKTITVNICCEFSLLPRQPPIIPKQLIMVSLVEIFSSSSSSSSTCCFSSLLLLLLVELSC